MVPRFVNVCWFQRLGCLMMFVRNHVDEMQEITPAPAVL